MHVDTCVSFVQPFWSGASSTSCIPRASFAGVTTAEPAKMCQKVHIRERKCQNNAREIRNSEVVLWVALGSGQCPSIRHGFTRCKSGPCIWCFGALVLP